MSNEKKVKPQISFLTVILILMLLVTIAKQADREARYEKQRAAATSEPATARAEANRVQEKLHRFLVKLEAEQAEDRIPVAESPGDGLDDFEESELGIWGQRVLESFEVFCYQTEARYESVLVSAQANGLQEVYGELRSMATTPRAKKQTAYLVASEEGGYPMIVLGISEPDACSIVSRGISVESVKNTLISEYKLMSVRRDDVGEQVREVFVPGGVYGSKKEAATNGIVTIIYASDMERTPVFTVSYASPDTVAMSYGNR